MKPLHGVAPEKKRIPKLTKGNIQRIYFAQKELPDRLGLPTNLRIRLRCLASRNEVQYKIGNDSWNNVSTHVRYNTFWGWPYYSMHSWSTDYVDWEKLEVVFVDKG